MQKTTDSQEPPDDDICSEMLAESLVAAKRISVVVEKLSQMKKLEYREYLDDREIIDLREKS